MQYLLDSETKFGTQDWNDISKTQFTPLGAACTLCIKHNQISLLIARHKRRSVGRFRAPTKNRFSNTNHQSVKAVILESAAIWRAGGSDPPQPWLHTSIFMGRSLPVHVPVRWLHGCIEGGPDTWRSRWRYHTDLLPFNWTMRKRVSIDVHKMAWSKNHKQEMVQRKVVIGASSLDITWTSRHIRRHKVMGLQRTAVKRNTHDLTSAHTTILPVAGSQRKVGQWRKLWQTNRHWECYKLCLGQRHHLGSCSKFPTFCMQFSSQAIQARDVSHPKQIIEFFFIISIVWGPLFGCKWKQP